MKNNMYINTLQNYEVFTNLKDCIKHCLEKVAQVWSQTWVQILEPRLSMSLGKLLNYSCL